MPEKYVLGIDFGTQSGRATLVRVTDGKELNACVQPYEHGVITESLPSGTKLPPNFALQHPKDYLNVLKKTISEVVQKSGKAKEHIIGLGIATTASTIIPVLEDGAPLCFLPEFANDPHSWPKLWKHHGAQAEALELDTILQEKEPELAAQFGASSAERMLPKVLEVKRRSPEVYAAAYTFVELTDWLTWQLTGKLQRSAAVAGYKAMWRPCTGYLTEQLLKDQTWEYAQLINEKLPGPVIPLGTTLIIDSSWAADLGLAENTVITTGHIDAHSAALGCGISEPGTLVMVMGTSSCYLMLAEQLEFVEGMSGAVQGGIVGDFYAYESGQSSVGDQFHWFVENSVPGRYFNAAKNLNLNIHTYLEQLANELPLGRTGLLALDWWNGNRSVLNDASLSGLVLGLTTSTKPEEVYLALLESTAFGAKRIIESFEERGLPVTRIYATGGLPQKNELLIKLYASVTNREIEVVYSDYTSALGMAMWASTAAGVERGGYKDIYEAVLKMAPRNVKVYKPDAELVARYEVLYEEYKVLYDYFGRGKNKVMGRLKALVKQTT